MRVGAVIHTDTRCLSSWTVYSSCFQFQLLTPLPQLSWGDYKSGWEVRRQRDGRREGYANECVVIVSRRLYWSGYWESAAFLCNARLLRFLKYRHRLPNGGYLELVNIELKPVPTKKLVSNCSGPMESYASSWPLSPGCGLIGPYGFS